MAYIENKKAFNPVGRSLRHGLQIQNDGQRKCLCFSCLVKMRRLELLLPTLQKRFSPNRDSSPCGGRNIRAMIAECRCCSWWWATGKLGRRFMRQCDTGIGK